MSICASSSFFCIPILNKGKAYVIVTAFTYKLADGYFAFKDLGKTQIKGVEEPVHTYQVLGVGQLRTRFQARATPGELRWFVGRQNELEELQKALYGRRMILHHFFYEPFFRVLDVFRVAV